MLKKFLVLLFIFLLSGCSQEQPAITESQPDAGVDTLFQTSTLSALNLGVYDGDLTIGELKEHGDFGLGTFDALNGEMVVLDGQVYQVTADGQASVAGDEARTPFAAVTPFEADQTLTFDQELDCADFRSQLDEALGSLNEPYAIKVQGTFPYMKVRAPHEQSKPYPNLTDALADQVVFESQDASGTMVGFRLPDYLGGVNATGYHFHFLTEDLVAGGHVLDCRVGEVQVGIDLISEVLVDIPQTAEFQNQAAPVAEASPTAAPLGPVVLGALYSLTGGQSGLDIPSAQGAQMAVDQANAAGGVLGREVQLVLEDAASEPAVIADKSAALLQDYPAVSAFLGLSDTDLVEAAAPIAAADGRLFLTSGATSPKLPELAPGYLFLACFGDNVQAAAGAEWAYNSQGARSAAVLYRTESTYTELLQGYFQSRFQELGGQIVSVEGYDPEDSGDSGITAAVGRLEPADLVYLAATPDEVLTAVQAVRESGFQGPILGGDGLDIGTMWAGQDVEQVYFTTHAYLGADNTDSEVVAFRQAFAETYPDGTPDAFTALGYDAANLLITAVRDAGSSDPLAVRAALANIQDFPGVTGQISYANGDEIPTKSVSIIGVSGGSVGLVEEVIPAKVPMP